MEDRQSEKEKRTEMHGVQRRHVTSQRLHDKGGHLIADISSRKNIRSSRLEALSRIVGLNYPYTTLGK